MGLIQKYNLWKLKKICKKEQIRVLYSDDIERDNLLIINSKGIATPINKVNDNYYEYKSDIYSYKVYKNSNYLEFLEDIVSQIDDKIEKQSKMTYEELLKDAILEDIKIETLICNIELKSGVDINKENPDSIEVLSEDGELLEEENKLDILKNMYFGTLMYCYNVVGVETGNIYVREETIVIDKILNLPFILSEEHMKTLLKNYYKGITISLKEYVELENIYDNIPNNNNRYTLYCGQCKEAFYDAQSFYNHLYKTGHKDSSYFEFPFDIQLLDIKEKHQLEISDEEIEEFIKFKYEQKENNYLDYEDNEIESEIID